MAAERTARASRSPRTLEPRGETPAPNANASGSAAGRARQLDFGFLETLLGYKLRRAQLAAFADFTEKMAALQVTTGQLGALALVQLNPGVTQTVLGEALGIKRASVVPLIDRLEQRGLLVRRTPRTDRRSNALYLTAAGERLLAEIRPRLLDHERSIAAGLSAEELRMMHGMLRRIGR
jgi:DNA-binding MarR family transcriptional regulator